MDFLSIRLRHQTLSDFVPFFKNHLNITAFMTECLPTVTDWVSRPLQDRQSHIVKWERWSASALCIPSVIQFTSPNISKISTDVYLFEFIPRLMNCFIVFKINIRQVELSQQEVILYSVSQLALVTMPCFSGFWTSPFLCSSHIQQA